jgi:hypothetical protein
MDDLEVVLVEADIAADEEVLALCAEAGLIEVPPLLEGIVSLKKLQLTAKGGEEGMERGGRRLLGGFQAGLIIHHFFVIFHK